MLFFIQSISIISRSPEYMNLQTLNIRTGGAMSNCVVGKNYSTYYQQCGCDKGTISDLLGACVVGNTPAMNQYIVTAALSLNPSSEINCADNLSLGYNGLTPICGIPIKLPFGVFKTSEIVQCQAGMQVSPYYRQCVSDLNVADQVASSRELCVYGNQRACLSGCNIFAKNKYGGTISCMLTSTSSFNILGAQPDRMKYEPYNTSKQPGQQPMYNNIVGMTYVLSDINGTIYYQSQFLPQYFDLCALLETNIDPNFQQLQGNWKPRNRDRRFHHNYTYYDIEMLSRYGYDAIDVDYPGYYPTMFGNSYNYKCRMGIQNAMKLPELFLTFFTNSEFYDENIGLLRNTNRIIQITNDERSSVSVPIMSNNSGQITVLSSLTFTNYGNNDKVESPKIQVTFQELSTQNVIKSPFHNQDISSYTFQNTTSSRAATTQFVDFQISVIYNKNLQIEISYHFIACFLFGIIYEFVFNGLLQLERLQGAGNRGCNNNTRIKHIGLIMFAVVRGLAMGVFFDACLTYLLMMTSWRLQANREFNRDYQIYCLTFFLFSLVHYAVRLHALVKAPTKFFLFDHHHNAENSPWRRLFAANALRKLLRAEAVPYWLLCLTITFFVWCLDLQYTAQDTAQLNTSIQTTKAIYFCPMLCFTALVCYMVLGIIMSIYRFFKKNPFERFGDILSLLNCSVIGFDGPHSCHLVYGRAPFGDTERTPDDLAKILKRESKGLYPRRGLYIGQSAQYFRVFFNKKNDLLNKLYEALDNLFTFENCDGEIGDSIEGAAHYDNNRALITVPGFSPHQFELFSMLNDDLSLTVQHFAEKPMFYSSRYCKLLDVLPPRLPRLLDTVVVVDTTEALGPRAVDDGHKLPGGYGAAPWFAQLFRFNLAFWDMISLCGIASVSTLALGFGYGMIIAFTVTFVFREVEVFYMRRNMAITMLVPETYLR